MCTNITDKAYLLTYKSLSAYCTVTYPEFQSLVPTCLTLSSHIVPQIASVGDSNCVSTNTWTHGPDAKSISVRDPRLHTVLMIAQPREQVLVVQKLTDRRRSRCAGVAWRTPRDAAATLPPHRAQHRTRPPIKARNSPGFHRNELMTENDGKMRDKREVYSCHCTCERVLTFPCRSCHHRHHYKNICSVNINNTTTTYSFNKKLTSRSSIQVKYRIKQTHTS